MKHSLCRRNRVDVSYFKYKMKTLVLFVLCWTSGFSVEVITVEDHLRESVVIHSATTCDEIICSVRVGVTPVIGYEGGEVDIRCPYEDKYDKYTKYLCRGECLIGQSIKIEHGQTSAAEGRFSLYDNTTAGSFTVTITGLTAQDSGKYWCGIDRPSWKDLYTELQLSVKKVVSVSGCEGHSVSITCNYERSCRDQHEKYFCRGDKTSSCIATGLKVSTSVKERGRFSLEDDPAAKVFNVGIGELSAEDTGIYWCVEWCGELLFTTAVHLEVKREPTTLSPAKRNTLTTLSKEKNPPTQKGASGIFVILSGTLTVAAFLFGVSLFVLRRLKRHKSQGPSASSNRNTRVAYHTREIPSPEYEEIKDTRKSETAEARDNPIYSEALLPTNPSDDPMYSTVRLPRSPSDGPAYSSILFMKNPDQPDATGSEAASSKDDSDYCVVKTH
ncbi:uncharacterized protein LOC114767421 [Denticeps clupeoides]|uniref:uncharacterized protein LOC114767421 n=1 Tax=Denticeps clupeoides TaxID=299321 RepID=UPI0010A37F69|nr:uncharacterized protein LOC114767421 [Denticeps clupeoides]